VGWELHLGALERDHPDLLRLLDGLAHLDRRPT
jgi:hypothetical protein